MEMTVERARRGDPAAFEQLYREHSRWVYALARRLADDDADASDMTQDVFIRLWQKLDTFRADSVFPAWLRKLAVNVCLNRMSDERLAPRGFSAPETLRSPQEMWISGMKHLPFALDSASIWRRKSAFKSGNCRP